MYRKIRFYIRLLSAFIKKYLRIFLFGLLLGIVAFFLIPGLLSLLPQIRSTHRVAFIGRSTLGSLPLPIQQQISIGLTSIDAAGLPSAAIASSWEATDSGKTYIFTLNPHLVWQDSKPLVSEDIKYNFRDAKIEYPDATHLVIKLADPFSPLPTIVSAPVFKVVKPMGLFFDVKYYGLGSYKIKSYRKNGAYLDTLTLTPVEASGHLPKIQYFFYPSQAAARTAFKMGIVNEITGVQDLGELKNWPGTTVTPQILTDRYVAVFFNVQDPNLTGAAGKNLRLALTYAVDKSRWANRVYGPIATSSWAYDSDLRHYDQDLDKAKELLKKVEKIPDKITLTTLPAYMDVADAIKSDWERLGLTVDIQVALDIPGSFQALLAAQAVPADPDQYNYWHSTKGTNLTGIKNPRIDKKLEDGRKTFDRQERKDLYFDFQKTLADEVAAIFLFSPQTYTITRN